MDLPISNEALGRHIMQTIMHEYRRRADITLHRPPYEAMDLPATEYSYIAAAEVGAFKEAS